MEVDVGLKGHIPSTEDLLGERERVSDRLPLPSTPLPRRPVGGRDLPVSEKERILDEKKLIDTDQTRKQDIRQMLSIQQEGDPTSNAQNH